MTRARPSLSARLAAREHGQATLDVSFAPDFVPKTDRGGKRRKRNTVCAPSESSDPGGQFALVRPPWSAYKASVSCNPTVLGQLGQAKARLGQRDVATSPCGQPPEARRAPATGKAEVAWVEVEAEQEDPASPDRELFAGEVQNGAVEISHCLSSQPPRTLEPCRRQLSIGGRKAWQPPYNYGES